MANLTLQPPTDPLASRLFLGPALRAQPDRRLVRLVREGCEPAFEEIVRRYRRALERFAGAIVGGRAEDVVQDSLSKALPALERSDGEIELRAWLYRIVRNTALNDLRDRPPVAEELGEDHLAGGRSAAAEAESRERFGELTAAMRALPDPQRSAIVMRELEGLSHDEIAGALGVSGGAARQTIHRARTALRAGFGALLPLPLLRSLGGHGAAADHGAEVATGGGAVGIGAAGASGVLSGGAVGAVKVGLATVLIAGGVGAGVAVHHQGGGKAPVAAVSKAASAAKGHDGGASSSAPADGGAARDTSFTGPLGEDSSGSGGHGRDGRHGHRDGPGEQGDSHSRADDHGTSHRGSGADDSSGDHGESHGSSGGGREDADGSGSPGGNSGESDDRSGDSSGDSGSSGGRSHGSAHDGDDSGGDGGSGSGHASGSGERGGSGGSGSSGGGSGFGSSGGDSGSGSPGDDSGTEAVTAESDGSGSSSGGSERGDSSSGGASEPVEEPSAEAAAGTSLAAPSSGDSSHGGGSGSGSDDS